MRLLRPGQLVREHRPTKLLDFLAYLRCKYAHRMWGGHGCSVGSYLHHDDITDITCQTCGRVWYHATYAWRRNGRAPWSKTSALWQLAVKIV